MLLLHDEYGLGMMDVDGILQPRGMGKRLMRFDILKTPRSKEAAHVRRTPLTIWLGLGIDAYSCTGNLGALQK